MARTRHQPDSTVEAALTRQRLCQPGQASGLQLAHHGRADRSGDRRLVSKRGVDRGLSDARGIRDVPHRGSGVAISYEERPCRLHDRRAGGLRLSFPSR